MNIMKKTMKKTFLLSLSFSLFILMVSLIANQHLTAQNSGDLSPISLEAFQETMNEEIIALRIEMYDPGVNSENNLALFTYYISVRDYYSGNPVELQHAFESQLFKLKQYDISLSFANALLDESAPSGGPAGSTTAVSGNQSFLGTALQVKPSSPLQNRINQLQIIDGRTEGFSNLFEFIRSHK
jgi:hypothetical protein